MTGSLIEAIKQGDQDRVRELLSADPQRIRLDDAAISPILLSVYMGQREITAILLDTGVDLTLHEAAACGDADRVQAILQDQPERIDEYGSDGFTPLGLAAYFGYLDVVKLLLARGAQVNLHSRNAQKVAALHSAVSAQHGDIINLLIEHGANVNAKQEQDITPLMQVAHHGDSALVRQFLDLGADPTATTTDGKTALSFAEAIQAEDVIALLRG